MLLDLANQSKESDLLSPHYIPSTALQCLWIPSASLPNYTPLDLYPPLQGAQSLALKWNQALRFYQEQPLSPGRVLRLVTQSWQLACYMLSTACVGVRAAVTSWWLRPLKDSPTPSQASLLLHSVPWEWWHTTGTACRIWMEPYVMKPFPSPLPLKVGPSINSLGIFIYIILLWRI